MQKETYKITELDCAEECNLLTKALKSREGIHSLDFDVINRQMVVTYDPTIIDSGKVLEMIKSTGMTATRAGEEVDETFWQQKGRLILCVTSGLFLAVGFLLHLMSEGVMGDVTGFEARFDFPPIFPTIFYLLAIASGGWFVAPKALISLKNRSLDMNVLMVAAVCGAIAIGQLFEAATVTFLFSLALLLESWSVERARKAISTLLDLSPTLARVMQGEQLVEMQVEDVSIGSRILIRPGEKVPLDGTVASGTSSINQAPITGESIPVSKGEGDPVFAGTINEDGALEVTTTKGANDTTLSRIIQMVQDARSRKAKSEKWVDRFSRIYTPIMMLLAIAVILIPPLFFDQLWLDWIYRGLVLLVIACPCALVISTPVSVVSALTSAARSGVLIKGGVFLEAAAHIQAIAFDKTGTITLGKPKVQKIVPLNNHTEDDLLEIAASLEVQSEHPLARAILEKAKERGIKPQGAIDFQIFKGLGAEGTVDGKRFWIGSHRFMHDKKRKESLEAHEGALKLEDAGHSVIAIGDFTHICGLISVADSPRPYIAETLSAIKDLGVDKRVMLTGDNEQTARALAAQVGLTDYKAELLPEDKLEAIEQIKETHPSVAMIGDGVNDAPAMAASTLGIAMGGLGTDAAFETADIVLMTDDLSQVPWLIRHARKTLGIIKQNIIFALSLKALFIVLAVVGIATLWMAIAADTGASLLVVFNGLRLLKR